jgi:hypothetical protein
MERVPGQPGLYRENLSKNKLTGFKNQLVILRLKSRTQVLITHFKNKKRQK